MRLQLILTNDLKFDLDNYCKDNGLKASDIIRHLIRTEIYQEQSLAKKIPSKMTKEELKSYKNVKNAKVIHPSI